MTRKGSDSHSPGPDPDEVQARFAELTADLSLTLGPRDYELAPDTETDFVPPPPPPIPHHRTTLILSWLLALGGLLVILVVTVFLPSVSNSVAIGGAFASLIGWLWLFWHLPKVKPDPEDENGAVV